MTEPTALQPTGPTSPCLCLKGEERFELGAAQVRELQRSIDETYRGEVIDGWQLLKELRK